MKLTILTVSTAESTRAHLRDCLPEKSFEVVEARTRDEVLNALSRSHVRFSILDLSEANSEGFEVLQLLQTHEVETLALVSGDTAEKALSHGAKDFLRTPFDSFELRHRLMAVVKLHEVETGRSASLDFDMGVQKFGDLPFLLYEFSTKKTSLETWILGDLELLGGPHRVALFAEIWNELVHPGDRVELSEIYQCIRDNRSTEWRVRFRWRVNHTTILHVGSFDSDKHIVRGVLIDVTEAKELRAKHIERQKIAAVGLMASGIAHDFNNLLCVILSFSRFAQDEMSEGSQSWSDLDEVIKASERAAGLTRQLLTFAREREPLAETIDLNERLSDLNGILARLLGEVVELNVNMAPGHAIVLMDPVQFDQVVINLAVNARDAMEPDGGRLCISLEIPFTGEDKILLKVQDWGPGMSPDTMERIFEPFFTTKRKGHGTGLGLATCFSIVDQVGGQIQVDSTLGGGTTFTVTLPTIEAITRATNPKPALAPIDHGLGILVVEDDAVVRHVCKRVLEKAGYNVYLAENGREGVRRLGELQNSVNLVLLDIVMPELGGLKLAEYIYANYPDTSVLFFTGYPEKAGLGSASAPVLIKPFDREDLLAAVVDALGTPTPDAQNIKLGEIFPPEHQRQRSHQVEDSSLRVLLVEDNEIVRKIQTFILAADGYDVQSCNSVKSATEALSQSDFDAVVLDVRLPDGSGLDLLQHTKDIPVIVLTARPKLEDAQAVIHGSVHAYLAKPASAKELTSKVRQAIETVRLERLQGRMARRANDQEHRSALLDLDQSKKIFREVDQDFSLRYQPIVRAKDASVFGYETLFRCGDSVVASTGDVFLAAEVLDKVAEFGATVRSVALKALEMNQDGLETMFLNVNSKELVSGAFSRPDDPLHRFANRIALQMTQEACFRDLDKLGPIWNELRLLGYRFSIIRVGRRSRDWECVEALRPDFVKITISLTRQIEASSLRMDIVGALIETAHQNQISVVGSGVKTVEERDVLAGLGCDLLQGEYLSAPLPTFASPEKRKNKQGAFNDRKYPAKSPDS